MSWKTIMLCKYNRKKKKWVYEDGKEAKADEIRFTDGTWLKVDFEELIANDLRPTKDQPKIEIWIDEE